jgi:hypothetical protein
LIAAIIAASTAALALAAPAQAAAADVTATPMVQRDLRAADDYFDVVTPDAADRCPSVSVFVDPMAAAIGNDGQRVAAGNVWAQTAIGSCTIDLSRSFWGFLTRPGFGPNMSATLQTSPNNYRLVPATGRWAVAYGCAVIVHEYGHVLGLPDTAHGLPIMSMINTPQDVPPCNLMAYGWKRISHRDRLWLVGARDLERAGELQRSCLRTPDTPG